jgi:hypothetical protein
MRNYIDEYLDVNPTIVENIIENNITLSNNEIINILIDKLYLFDEEDQKEYYNELIENYKTTGKLT